MSYYFPEGTRIYFSNSLGVATPITSITNANPGVANAAAHGHTNGTELLITSAWNDINETVVRAAGVAAGTFQLEGVNTTDTTIYPSGANAGAGAARAITNWVEVPQAMEPSTEGGDAKFTDIMLLARTQDISIPTGFNSSKIGVTIAWDPALPGLQTMLSISRTRKAVALKFAVGGGATLYGYGYMTMREMPNMNRGQVMDIPASFSLNGRPVGYAAP